MEDSKLELLDYLEWLNRKAGVLRLAIGGIGELAPQASRDFDALTDLADEICNVLDTAHKQAVIDAANRALKLQAYDATVGLLAAGPSSKDDVH